MAPSAERWKKLVWLFRKEIWQPAYLTDRSLLGRFYAVLRVVSITVSGLRDNKTASRAAALSFSSLLGLGPLVAITVLVAGFVLGKRDPTLVIDRLAGLLNGLLPQIGLYEKIDTSANTGLVDLFNGFIAGARSGSAGALGMLSLILIVLLLFKSIEDTFNDIWGVRTGRSIMMRVVFYWTILTLGAVLFFAAVTLLGAGAFVNVFNHSIRQLPGGHELLAVLRWSLPAFASILFISILMLFYRVIPNTHVFWRAAFA
ncbi:MAG: YihY/virulence factor BrkB family protein, partial [Verrucomicrobiota bacterium]|nr:YihY/virulence factor BrkB family protein [Verrucomicrobiota bacterium]